MRQYINAPREHKQCSSDYLRNTLGLRYGNLDSLFHAFDFLVFALEQKWYGKAESIFERSLAIRKKALGADHPDVARSLNDLAGVFVEQVRIEYVFPGVRLSRQW